MDKSHTYRIRFSDNGRSIVNPTLIACARVGRAGPPIQLASVQADKDGFVYFIDLTLDGLSSAGRTGLLSRNMTLEYADEATRDAEYELLQQWLTRLCGITLVPVQSDLTADAEPAAQQ